LDSEVLCRVVLGLSLLLAGCASTAPSQPFEYLDEQTAATITTVGEPLVFARERPELAANVRDYATLAGASVNRSGKYQYVLIAYFWSTVDLRPSGEALPAPSSPVIIADDRRITLSSQGKPPQDYGIDTPVHVPTGVKVAPIVYPTDIATLRFIAAARQLAMNVGGPADVDPMYPLWKGNGQVSLGEFVAYIGRGGRSPR
jgi:hypothetical protein